MPLVLRDLRNVKPHLLPRAKWRRRFVPRKHNVHTAIAVWDVSDGLDACATLPPAVS
jgi:hypothetical protein